MATREHLQHRWGLTLYRVPQESADEFLDLQRRAEAVFRDHAWTWSLWRSRKDPDEWLEHGPTFRERAAIEHAADPLGREGKPVGRLPGIWGAPRTHPQVQDPETTTRDWQ